MGHAYEVSPQQPWGGGTEPEGMAPSAPGSVVWGRGRDRGHTQPRGGLQRLEPAVRVQEEGEARRTGSQKPEAVLITALAQHKASPATGWCHSLRVCQLGWAEEAQEAGCVCEWAPGRATPCQRLVGGPGELAAKAEGSPPWLWDLGPLLRTVRGAQTTGVPVTAG